MSLSQDAANSRGVRVAELPGRAEAADAGLCGCVSAPCFGVGRALRDGAGELCAFPHSHVTPSVLEGSGRALPTTDATCCC